MITDYDDEAFVDAIKDMNIMLKGLVGLNAELNLQIKSLNEEIKRLDTEVWSLNEQLNYHH